MSGHGRRLWLAGVVLCAGIWGGTLSAEVRPWVWARPAKTQAAGEPRVEYSIANRKADTDNIVVTSWLHQLEFRYGVGAGWEFGMIQGFLQSQDADGTALAYQGWKLAGQYEFDAAGAWPVGPALSAEYIRTENWLEPASGTLSAILSARVVDLELAYHHTIWAELQANGDVQESYQAAVGRELTPWLSAALESQGSYRHGRYALGITGCVFRHERFGFAWGAVWGLNANTPDVESRMVLSMGW